jgi:hypothetical protein
MKTTRHCGQISLIYYGMRNVSDERCIENPNTHFVFNNFLSQNHAFYEEMWKNMVDRGRQ